MRNENVSTGQKSRILSSGSFTAVLVLLPFKKCNLMGVPKHEEGAELYPKCSAINSWAGSSLGTIFLGSLTHNEVQEDRVTAASVSTKETCAERPS